MKPVQPCKNFTGGQLMETYSMPEEEANKAVDAGRDGGSAVLLTKHVEGIMSINPIKLYTRVGQAHLLSISRGAQAVLDEFGLEFNLEEHLGAINDPPRA